MFTNTNALAIPEGNVISISKGTVKLWERYEEPTDGLPRTYQQVEWIGSDNSTGNTRAFLDLGFTFDTKARIEMTQYVTAQTTGYAFGSAENSGKLRCMLTSPNSNNANALFYGSTGSAYISVQPTLVNGSYNEFVFTLESGNLHAYNKTTGSEDAKTTQGAYIMTNNLYLFAQNYNGSARYAGKTQIVSFKYYDKNDELICDLVPCYRKSDGEIGMYDLIRKIFLTNIETGTTFLKGADVTT